MNNLKQIRYTKEMTQAKVAEAAGIERASYTMIETGARRPSVEVAKRIAKVLDFDWTLFYEEQEA